MAKLTTLFNLAAVTLVLTLFAAQVFAKSHAAEAPATTLNKQPGRALAHPPAPAASPSGRARNTLEPDTDIESSDYIGDFYEVPKICQSVLTYACTKELYDGIYRDGSSVSEGCCVKLVAMKKMCRSMIFRASVLTAEMLSEKISMKKRYKEMWSRCAFFTNTLL